jgi:threonine dehydrogenase-like Zn-dependent dehydrogenase
VNSHSHDVSLYDSGVECRMVAECKDEKAFNGVAAEHAGKYDVVVDATGSPEGLLLSAGLCRPMGTLVRGYYRRTNLLFSSI